MPDRETIPTTVEIATIDLGSRARAVEQMQELQNLENVQALRMRGTVLILTVREEVAHCVYHILWLADLVDGDGLEQH
ncbi:MAG: hypothetical protein WCX29_00890 [Candidatus Peribacteraceae bacterium]|jgi:hypothetical protein|nr:hypothetical protein [Candidatus Peribacteria bacterium]